MVRQSRRCSRSGCAQPAAATLTYVYAESTAVVEALARDRETVWVPRALGPVAALMQVVPRALWRRLPR